jgi:hypothetical protein
VQHSGVLGTLRQGNVFVVAHKVAQDRFDGLDVTTRNICGLVAFNDLGNTPQHCQKSVLPCFYSEK